jgi:hypothetical protein
MNDHKPPPDNLRDALEELSVTTARLAFLLGSMAPLCGIIAALDEGHRGPDGQPLPDSQVVAAFENGNVTLTLGMLRRIEQEWKRTLPHAVPMYAGLYERPQGE